MLPADEGTPSLIYVALVIAAVFPQKQRIICCHGASLGPPHILEEVKEVKLGLCLSDSSLGFLGRFEKQSGQTLEQPSATAIPTTMLEGSSNMSAAVSLTHTHTQGCITNEKRCS